MVLIPKCTEASTGSSALLDDDPAFETIEDCNSRTGLFRCRTLAAIRGTSRRSHVRIACLATRRHGARDLPSHPRRTAVVTAWEFKGDDAESRWLLNEDIALIDRAYSTFDLPPKITSSDLTSAEYEVFEAGSSVAIQVDDSKLFGWTKLELYGVATMVANWRKAKPNSP